MPFISSDKNIRGFVLNLLRSGQWEIIRHAKHVIIRHTAKGANKTVVIPSTPSDPRTFDNLSSIKGVIPMSKHNGQPPINPHGAGWPSTTGGKSGGGRGSNPPKGR